ncbi:amidase [Edaphobacter sp.]|uniref:amidase n=1 Tax=Edaphobacter sp. TaxID=1934404 RepID=UPI002DC00291|nr:amidase [Edaphobacter sp.]HEU5340360.1 amidase [Edaphobacter sp.]
MSDLVTKPAVELLSLLGSRKISPLELAEEHIRQIEMLNPQLNALIDFNPDRVRAQAAALSQSSTPKGPLHGLPITVKASIAVAGHRSETGSLINKGCTPTEDAVIVARARQAGAIILGTTNCPEFLMAYETDNLLYGPTSNPWDLTRTAGGSSGGESAAIAAGFSAAGFGSDSGGSVRTPAHFTGICALKPTPGRIPARGHLPPCVGPFSLIGTIGPMARTVADVALLFQTLSGRDDADPTGAPVALRQYTIEELKSIHIGFLEDDGHTPVTPETRQAIRETVRSLRKQGFHVEPFHPRALEQARQLWWKFFVRAGAMFFDPVIAGREADLSPTFRGFLDIAHQDPPLTGEELLFAWAESDVIRAKLLEEMRRFPVLITPVCSVPAFRHGERSWIIDGQRVEYLDAMRYTQWFNLLGSPAAVVPAGWSTEGLPIGVQIAGRPYEDELVLGIAATIERDFGYIAPPIAVNA